MANFALIAEGKTDHAVLHNILIGMYGVDVEVNIKQPLHNATDESRNRSDSLGGWEQVFQYCQHENFDEIFEYNDYVIIQIDTDVGEEVNFGVPLSQDGIDRPVDDLVCEVRKKIIEKLSHPVYEKYESQFLFAIAVRSLECWLLPLYAKQKAHATKTKNCANQLERDAKRLGLDYRKEYRTYDNLSVQYRKPKELKKAKQHHPSLALFLDSLPQP